jgi:3-phenylpropionate/cinnamic acid dioxygenase small subunit
MDIETEISNLIYIYAESLDAGDLEKTCELFESAQLIDASSGAVISGSSDILSVYRHSIIIHGNSTPRTKHVTSNIIFDIDEGNGLVETRSYFTVFQQTAKLPLQTIIAGRYHDAFARTDGIWHFTQRKIYTDLLGDVSHHMNISVVSG